MLVKSRTQSLSSLLTVIRVWRYYVHLSFTEIQARIVFRKEFSLREKRPVPKSATITIIMFTAHTCTLENRISLIYSIFKLSQIKINTELKNRIRNSNSNSWQMFVTKKLPFQILTQNFHEITDLKTV